MERLIKFALNQRLLILLATLLIVGWGAFSFKNLPIDAFPDLTNVQVQVLTTSEGMAPAEVERLVTFPIEVEMNGLPNVTEVRSQSKFGLSVITVVFKDEVDTYFARQLVAQKLQGVQGELPEGVTPEMGPITTGLGEIFQYTLEGPQSLMDKRTVQDWIASPILRTVPGVTEVNSFGGAVKQYQVLIDPDKLQAYGLTLHDVFESVAKNNANAGGNYIEHGAEQYLIRGLGLVNSIADIGNIVVTARDGRPVYVKDVSQVTVGPMPRQGATTVDGKGEAVAGIVMKLKGENTRDVIERVKEKLPAVQAALPAGMKLVPYLDQTELVEKAVGTVEKALTEGGVLVVAVLFLFLWHVRSSLIVAATIPVSMLIAFGMMKQFGIPGNLMSLGGLAIGIGMMVDAAIVMVENIFRHLAEDHERHDIRHVVLEAAKEVARPITFSIVIIIVVFLPLFTLQGMEGKMFSPMAFTISFAMLGSLLLSLTLVPVLCVFFLKGKLSEKENPIVGFVKRFYLPALAWALDNRKMMVGGAIAALLAALALYPFIGSEFMPQLEEGSIAMQAVRLPSISLSTSVQQSALIEQALLSFPEVEKVVSRTGRAEVANDPMGVDTSDIFVKLKPRETWKRSKEALVSAMSEELEKIPGINFSFSQPIAMRVDELVSGVKTQVAVKLFGEDLDVLQQKGNEIQAALAKVPGVADLQVEQVGGLDQVQIAIDRARIARYGLNVADVNEVVETAIGGKEATVVQEGQKRFAIAVRLPEERRKDLETIKNIMVSAPGGQRVPLSAIAQVSVETGPSQVLRENGQRRIVIGANVRGRDMGSFVKEAQARITRDVKLPTGYYMVWGGQFENQQRAMSTLSIVVPLVIGLIFVLLFSTFNSVRNALLIILNIPFALIGGILALFLSRLNMSVSASVGFIALFGVAVQNGVIMVNYFNALRQQGLTIREAILEGAAIRLRPVLMTALVASLGLIPLALSSGIGSEVQKPLAIVVIGGLVSSTLLTLLVLPTLYSWFERETLRVPTAIAGEPTAGSRPTRTETMRKIMAVLPLESLAKVLDALQDAEVAGVTVTTVKGYGQERDPLGLIERAQLEIILPEDDVDRIVQVIRSPGHTGLPGDGIITVNPVLSSIHLSNSVSSQTERPRG